MGDIGLLQTIGIMIVAAAIVVMIARRLNVPTIVLYILTGLVLASFFGLFGAEADLAAEEGELIEGGLGTIAEVGIVLLLFLVGLELSLEKIKDVGKVAVLAGLGQVVFTAAFGFVLAFLLQFTVMESIFIATALTFSSTVVVVKLLDQKKELSSLYGRIAVGIFLVQDLVVIVALTFLAGLGRQEEMEAGAMIWGLVKAFIGMGILLAVAMLASKYVLVKPFNWAARSSETLLIWSICWCFGFVIAAELMNLSPEIGAFLAGVSLAQLGCAEDLRRRVHPLMNFFIAIFFISLGAHMEFGDAKDYLFESIVLALFVLIGNPFIFMWIIARCGYGEKTCFMTSVTVAQISEFSFIFATMGLTAGLISQSVLSVITVVGLITIGVSAYMIYYNHGLYEIVRKLGLLKIFKAKDIDDEDREVPLRDHIVIVGMNALGRDLARRLHERGETVLAIDVDAKKLEGLPCRTMLGNVEYHAVIEEAALEHAKLGISALHIEETNILFAYHCKKLGVPAAIHAFDGSVFADLRKLNVDFLIDSKAQGSTKLVVRLQEEGLVGS
ncbi:MAG: portal protein [Phycisphaerales bacterium]|nr:MAG: portal protein [Phycisphaerales bacterium]